MLQLIVLVLNLPPPALLVVLAGGFLFVLTVFVLVACNPLAGKRIIHFLAALEEVFYSEAKTKPTCPKKRPSQKRQRGM